MVLREKRVLGVGDEDKLVLAQDLCKGVGKCVRGACACVKVGR